MNLINKRFKSIEHLNAEIFKEILGVIKIKNSPCFILSGGNSPRYLFENISQYKSDIVPGITLNDLFIKIPIS